MKATFTCSNCGAEITNLNFSWGKKQWLWSFLPMLVVIPIAIFPLSSLYRSKGDYRKDLQVTVVEKRIADAKYEILGTIQNSGKTRWENIELDAEFYGPDGKFLDEACDRVWSAVEPGATEHFKLEIDEPSPQIRANDSRLEIKIADAFSGFL